MAISEKNFINSFFKELAAGNAAIFAGAGLSLPAGYVDWRNLLRGVADELDLDVDRETDLVSLAQFHVNHSGSSRHSINQAIIEAISHDHRPTENHEILSRLPISTWWTTNYDKLIERSLKEYGKIVDVKSEVSQLAGTKPRRDAIVYKMHGDVDHPDKAVVTRDDYERYSTDRGAFINALSGDLVSKTFLFIGFSFTDPNIDQIFSRVRINFANNQRNHFAIFKNRTKAEDESNEAFAHARSRQLHVVSDLKRFNIQVLLVDSYTDITRILRELLNRFRRQTIFVSASAHDFSPWGEACVTEFMRRLGREIVSSNLRLATGLGLGVGNALFSGAIEEILSGRKGHIEDSLLIRPFPQAIADPVAREEVWEKYRRDILGNVGISLFLFGNKTSGTDVVLANGMRREFELSAELGVVTIPVGATGSIAEQLAQECLRDPNKFLSQLNEDERSTVSDIATPTDDLLALIPVIMNVLKKLSKKNP